MNELTREQYPPHQLKWEKREFDTRTSVGEWLAVIIKYPGGRLAMVRHRSAPLEQQEEILRTIYDARRWSENALRENVSAHEWLDACMQASLGGGSNGETS